MLQEIVVQLPAPSTEDPIFETIAKRLFPFKRSSERIIREVYNNQHANMELARTSVGSGFARFLTDLKAYSGVFAEKTADQVKNLLNSVDSGIKSTDDVIKNLAVTKNKQGAFLLGDTPVGAVHKILREGDLKKLIAVSKQNVPVTAADVSAFKKLVGNTPELALKNVDDVATVAKRERPHLNATVDNLDKIPDTAKRDLKKVESNLYRHFKEGAAVALTIGVVTVGVGWISQATRARKGCFMMTVVDGKTTSCKVSAYTCSTGDAATGNICKNALDYYNTTLVLMQLASAPDTDAQKIAIAAVAGVAVTELNAKLATVIDDHYPAVAKAIKEMGANRPKGFAVCDIKNDAVENGVVPPCRMCDPTANPVSTTFIDPEQYGENITFQCVTNPSVLDTISDAVVSTGHNLWDGVFTLASGTLKQIGILAAIILVLLMLVTFIARMLTAKRSEYMDLDDNASVRFQRY